MRNEILFRDVGIFIISGCSSIDKKNNTGIHPENKTENYISEVWESDQSDGTFGTKVIDEGKNVFDGHENHHTLEGLKLYKKDGYYYVFAPAGGVATG